MSSHFPKRIVCLTEEGVETLFEIGMGHLVVGVSAFVERPVEAKQLPVVCAFTGGSVKKVMSCEPDLVLGFSDIQKDLARDLIAQGLSVYIANHRSLSGILSYIKMLGYMVGAPLRTDELVKKLETKIKVAQDFAKTLKVKPRVYIEEWDEPMICGIEWFSEIVQLCGGISVTNEISQKGSLAKDRFVSSEQIGALNPDMILACWCGKEVDMDSFKSRVGLKDTNAVLKGRIFELDPAIFLQPGPAPILDGIDQLIEIFRSFDPNA